MDGDRSVELVRVPCLACGNRNRKARRACRECDGTGHVEKYVPAAAPAPVEDPDAR